ncbi:MAG: sugar ABC transporter permease [Sulfobacillus acidophilus]|uniref:Sugar ABC transporter permease n=1 Tax=Sulfobacillus acidophilus TaxID=53633 RepID=A0A2T2WJS1_9FIRM|nr:MAG: sugar ABC transporter permease [Sulfobacillus acidophilus]
MLNISRVRVGTSTSGTPAKTSPKDGWRAFLLLLPAFAFVFIFVYLPAGMSLVLGFFHYHLAGVDTTFGGLTDFKEALTYPVFWIAVRNTLYYALLMIPTTLIGAVLIAFLIQKQTRIYAIIRTAVLLPYITPVIATTISWLWMFNPQYGVLNAFLGLFHIPPSQWLLSPAMAMPSVALYSLWHNLGFAVVIVLAALGNVPKPVMEAAAIEGCNSWQRFWKILLPFLSPTLFFLVIITSITTFQAFSQVYALSGGLGGPEYATTTLLLLLYQTAFQYFHFSYAATMAIFLVLIILIFTLIQNWLAKRWVFYD